MNAEQDYMDVCPGQGQEDPEVVLRAQSIFLGDAGGSCQCFGKVLIGLGRGDLGVRSFWFVPVN